MPLWTKISTKDWIQQHLSLEGGSLNWTDTELAAVAEELARRYRPGPPGTWEVKPAHQTSQSGSVPLYVVARGETEIYTEENEEKAKTIARMLNSLDRAVSE